MDVKVVLVKAVCFTICSCKSGTHENLPFSHLNLSSFISK